MKRIIVLLIALIAVFNCATEVSAETTGKQLRFKDGKFRIAQITDMHWGYSDSIAVQKMVRKMVSEEHPQLIILTGDNVTDAPNLAQNKVEWQKVIGMLEETGVPYAIVMGNHDAEASKGMNADVLESWLAELTTRCINYPTTSNCFGHGNRALEILSEKSSDVAALVYVMDSNDYPADPELRKNSYYDWIHRDQIEWYEKTSDKYTARNGGKPLPSVAYYHICVPEYLTVATDPNTFGSYKPGSCSPASFNTGFFASAAMHKDIMGMFVGHDHSNDYCGILQNIALCYGRQSGVGGNEKTPLGSRIVDLIEGKRAFETWVRTVDGKSPTWYYPFGFNSTMLDDVLPAVKLKDVVNGVNYVYYEGPEKDCCASILVPKNKKGEGVMNNIDISKAPAEDHFGYTFDTYLLVEETSPYYFQFVSDDGAVLYIDDKLIVDNDGSHSERDQRTFVSLAKGYHHVVVKYFENYAGQSLKIRYANTQSELTTIPDHLLFIKKK